MTTNQTNTSTPSAGSSQETRHEKPATGPEGGALPLTLGEVPRPAGPCGGLDLVAMERNAVAHLPPRGTVVWLSDGRVFRFDRVVDIADLRF